ncbi:hypothetical protein MTR_7g069890 [Medicago truncatula]|uniref:Uncharacterized protein n=1 Tax=Medicago truncatula TaxID=3880 RepID=G7KT68_MEDTR|nr:hypothetical protein MTR_7g069890 [Medicago truncatula]
MQRGLHGKLVVNEHDSWRRRNEFNDLEQQQISVQEQKKNLVKIEKEEQRTRYLHCKT